MLAVGSYLQRQRLQEQAAAGLPPERLRFVHGKGEDTRLPAESFDLVSVMLVGGALLLEQPWVSHVFAPALPPTARLSPLACWFSSAKWPDDRPRAASTPQVCHELPAAASAAIFREAFRLLRPGGALAVMEMNPESPAFRRIFSNPLPYVAFKSTEPWLLEYLSLDMAGAMEEAGFLPARQLDNSPRHKTVVAVKPRPAP